MHSDEIAQQIFEYLLEVQEHGGTREGGRARTSPSGGNAHGGSLNYNALMTINQQPFGSTVGHVQKAKLTSMADVLVLSPILALFLSYLAVTHLAFLLILYSMYYMYPAVEKQVC